MRMRSIVNAIVCCMALAASAVAPMAHADDGKIVGRVARGGDDSAVRVCFKHDVEVKLGQEFAVVRHTLRTSSPKSTPIQQSARVGVLRIAAAGDDHCRRAEVVSGSARWLDWVSMQAGS